MNCINCKFIENSANCSDQYGYGGAILVIKSSLINLCYNCVFSKNKANNGGAVLIQRDWKFLNCINCIFKNNEADYNGGAILLKE